MSRRGASEETQRRWRAIGLLRRWGLQVEGCWHFLGTPGRPWVREILPVAVGLLEGVYGRPLEETLGSHVVPGPRGYRNGPWRLKLGLIRIWRHDAARWLIAPAAGDSYFVLHTGGRLGDPPPVRHEKGDGGAVVLRGPEGAFVVISAGWGAPDAEALLEEAVLRRWWDLYRGGRLAPGPNQALDVLGKGCGFALFET